MRSLFAEKLNDQTINGNIRLYILCGNRKCQSMRRTLKQKYNADVQNSFQYIKCDISLTVYLLLFSTFIRSQLFSVDSRFLFRILYKYFFAKINHFEFMLFLSLKGVFEQVSCELARVSDKNKIHSVFLRHLFSKIDLRG